MKKLSIKEYFDEEKINFKFGFIFFNLGIFFLASAPFISIIFIFTSIFISLIAKENYFQKNVLNILFISSFSIILINTFINYFASPLLISEYNRTSNFIGLFNWLPFFICFFLIQPYLKSIKYRNLSSLLFLSGTLPVIITGIGQYFFGWENQISFLNGNIIWFLKPINELRGLSGLFNNPNYAGSWLSMIWPLSLSFFIQERCFNFKKTISLLFLTTISLCMILTKSKDTILTLLIPLPFLLKLNFLKFLILFILPSIIFMFLNSNLIFSFQELIVNPVDFFKLNYTNIVNYFPRIEILRISIIAILNKPIFGWGAASFPFIYNLYKYEFINDKILHSHNLFLEISIIYGLISSILLFSIFIKLLFDSWKVVFKENPNIINKAWWFSALLFLINHTFDVTYYDVRISLAFWIILSGIYCIIKENQLTNNLKIKKL